MEQLGSTHEKIVEAIFMLVPFAGIVGNTFSAVARRETALAQLQASQEQVNGLFQVLSHDFSSPLLVAMIHSQRALESGTMEKKSVERIDSSLKKLERMLRNFRKLANVFVRKDEISVEPTAVATIVERVRGNLSETLLSKKIEISYVPASASDGVTILVDPTVAEAQIFQNLIHNAIKFSTPGSKVEVRVAMVDDATVTIEISDSGTGIAPEKLSRLFSWTEKTTTLGTLGEIGTGFGLPIVRMCVESVGGTIEVRSQRQSGKSNAPQGTTFTLRFRRGASISLQPKTEQEFQRAI
jgi:signal transduction histidine kinase